MNFTPSSEDIYQLLGKCTKLKTIQFTPAAYERLSSSSQIILKLAGVSYRFGRLRDLKYPQKIVDFARQSDPEAPCKSIANQIADKFGVVVTRQLVWYWRKTAISG